MRSTRPGSRGEARSTLTKLGTLLYVGARDFYHASRFLCAWPSDQEDSRVPHSRLTSTLALLSLTVALTLSIACTPAVPAASPAAGATSAPAAATAAPAGPAGRTLIIANAYSFTTKDTDPDRGGVDFDADPFFHAVYDTLLTFKPGDTTNPQPLVAESYTTSPD